MKLALLIAAATLAAAPASAQDHSQHQGHAAPTAAPATAAPAARFTLDTPIEQIAADPNGKAALDAALPGITTHEYYDMFKGMSLKQLQPMSDGKITAETLARAEAALAAVN